MRGFKKGVLITGAGGVLGQELMEQILRRKEADVIIYALELSKDRIPLKYLENRFVFSFDIKDWEDNKIPFEDIDIIIHCAFARSSDGKLLVESLNFTRDILEQAVNNDVSAFINISSQSVYDRKVRPLWTEESPIAPGEPDTFYALTKYSSELLTTGICNFSNTVSTNIRLASLVGKGMDERIISRFIKQAIEGQAIKLFGGDQITAYMDVRDAAAGLIALIDTDIRKWKTTYNLGNKWRYTLNEIAECVKEAGKKYLNNEVVIITEKADNFIDSGMDSSLFYEDTRWEPENELKKIILNIFSIMIK